MRIDGEDAAGRYVNTTIGYPVCDPVSKACIERVVVAKQSSHISKAAHLEDFGFANDDLPVEGGEEPVGGHEYRTVGELVVALDHAFEIIPGVVCLSNRTTRQV